MEKSRLKIFFEEYLYSTENYEEVVVINNLIDTIFKSGFDVDAIRFFSEKFDGNKKKELIIRIFNELESEDKTRQFEVVNVLEAFLTETDPLIQGTILPVYFQIISEEKQNFNLVFTTLKIFTQRWNEFNDDLKKKIFTELLNILDNPRDFFIEEGMFEITELIIKSKSSVDPTKSLFSLTEIKDYLKKLIFKARDSKGDSLYAGLESIRQIFETHPELINDEIYQEIIPIFKKIEKKIAIFYPAKRNYVKVGISFLNLILLFREQYTNADYISHLQKIIKRMASKIDHADIKYFLEILLYLLAKTVNLPKIQVIRPTFEIIRSLYQKKDRLDDYTSDLITQIITSIWPLLSDNDKDFFFEESNFDNSVI